MKMEVITFKALFRYRQQENSFTYPWRFNNNKTEVCIKFRWRAGPPAMCSPAFKSCAGAGPAEPLLRRRQGDHAPPHRRTQPDLCYEVRNSNSYPVIPLTRISFHTWVKCMVRHELCFSKFRSNPPGRSRKRQESRKKDNTTCFIVVISRIIFGQQFGT